MHFVHPLPQTSFTQSPQASVPTELLALLAITAPVLLSYSQTPSVTFYNQALALGGWGAWCAWLAVSGGWVRGGLSRGAQAMLAVLGLLVLAQAWGPWHRGLDAGLSLQAMGMTGAAALALVTGARVGAGPQRMAVVSSLCWALVVGAMVSLVLSFVQVFIPAWATGNPVAAASVAGRAVGNLRQPNHLSTFLLMGAAALVWMGAQRCRAGSQAASDDGDAVEPQPVAELVGLVLLVWGVVVSGSRTGMVGVAMLTVWGALDRSLPRLLRKTLMVMPLVYGLWSLGMFGWAHWAGQSFIGEARLQSGSDISSSRFGIWANALSLLKAHWLTGVGWGEFNFAWTLTPFPGRPVAFFDHSHNLVLQLLVELGVPLGGLVLLLLLYGYGRLVRPAIRPTLDVSSPSRMALYIVSLLLVHSMLEYPLWYAYFLLPTAFVWGLGLSFPCEHRAVPLDSAQPALSVEVLPNNGVASKEDSTPPAVHRPWVPAALGVGLSLAALWATVEYRRITEIYLPRDPAVPLAQRIVRGQSTLLYSHQADYAAATVAPHPGKDGAYRAFHGATHNLLDARLMIAWAKAEAERGQLERARHLANRVREFKHPLAREFLAPCAQAEVAASAPFQCGPDPALGFEAFR